MFPEKIMGFRTPILSFFKMAHPLFSKDRRVNPFVHQHRWRSKKKGSDQPTDRPEPSSEATVRTKSTPRVEAVHLPTVQTNGNEPNPLEVCLTFPLLYCSWLVSRDPQISWAYEIIPMNWVLKKPLYECKEPRLRSLLKGVERGASIPVYHYKVYIMVLGYPCKGAMKMQRGGFIHWLKFMLKWQVVLDFWLASISQVPSCNKLRYSKNMERKWRNHQRTQNPVYLPSKEHIPPEEKENHLQKCLFGGYLSSQQGSWKIHSLQRWPKDQYSWF